MANEQHLILLWHSVHVENSFPYPPLSQEVVGTGHQLLDIDHDMSLIHVVMVKLY